MKTQLIPSDENKSTVSNRRVIFFTKHINQYVFDIARLLEKLQMIQKSKMKCKQIRREFATKFNSLNDFFRATLPNANNS